ncbi:MAG: bifunctional metallophosphatase/5'-nucleotidase [Thermonemataceae bacterium]
MPSRRVFLKQSLVGATAVTIAPQLIWANKPPIKLVILHTNDMHSRIEPFPEDGRRNAGLGGMARRAALIKKVRQEEAHVLLLDAGDIFQGTPYFNFFGGELEFKLMSEMRYDAATLGNHDFDNGVMGLKKMLPFARFPFLVSNYTFSQDSALHNTFLPYKLFERGGLKIGVFGLGIELEGLVPSPLFKGTIYQDPVAVAKEMVQTLKAKDCDMIICLSHLGYFYKSDKVSDHTIAQQVEGIDLILGGHTHTFLERPTQLLSPSGDPVFIHQVGWAGLRLGRLEFIFHKGKRKELTQARSLVIGNESSEK